MTTDFVPQTPSDWRRLAQQAMQENRADAALDAWRELLWLRADDKEAILETARLEQARGGIKPAIELLQSALRRSPEDEDYHLQLGLLWLELAEWDKAEHHLHYADSDERAEAALAQLRRQRGHLSPAYARHLFNDYAPRFDEALAKLGYQAPQLLAQLLQPYLQSRSHMAIADLGCGTGLMAPYLRAHARELVGVDIAEKMLEQARQRGGYDSLLHLDMVAALNRPYELIVAADALVYVGALEALLKAVATCLPMGGLFAASVEVNGITQGFTLQDSKRYAHSRDYIEKLGKSCGLWLKEWQPAVLRQDRQQPIEGALFLLVRMP